MALLGLAAGVASSIFGMAKAAREARKQEKLLQEREKENQQWYDRRYNEDVTQRSDAQAYINRMRAAMAERSRATRGAQAVGGATDEAVAAQKAAEAYAMGNVIGRLAQQASARKDDIENAYLNRKDALKDARANISAQKAQNTIQAVGGLSQAVANFDDDNDILGNLFKKK